MAFTQVALKPTAGFCIKSTTLEPGLLPPPAAPRQAQPSTGSGVLLEPADKPSPIPKGLKIFVNICYDKGVPAPPDASEDAIQRAIKGSKQDEEELKESVNAEAGDEEEWYVPVVVSEPRLDKDKAGKPSMVVDCVYHSEVRKRTLRDPDFKIFLVELGLQRIEAQTGLTLSRHIGTPNIASKGKLEPRTVRIPTALLLNSSKQKHEPLTPKQQAVAGISKSSTSKNELSGALDLPRDGEGDREGVSGTADAARKGKKPLIEEVNPASAPKAQAGQPKSILKSAPPVADLQRESLASTSGQRQEENGLLIPLDVSWDWEKLESSGKLRVAIDIPDLTASSITSGQTFLDIEPNRILVTLGSPDGEVRIVDINRNLSDAQLAVKIKERARLKVGRVARGKGPAVRNEATKEELESEIMAESEREVERMLHLKRQPDFDVDGAKAQWIVKDKRLVVTF